MASDDVPYPEMDIYADVPNTLETLQARINEVYRAMLTVERMGSSPDLTAAVTALSERMRELRGQRRRRGDETMAHDERSGGDGE
jgi:hypothetical protein